MIEFKKSIAVLFICIMTTLFLTGCAFGKKEIIYNDQIPEICHRQLQNCFGKEYSLSEGVAKEEHFVDEFESVNVITHYTEWELTYEDAAGQSRRFVFNNHIGRKSTREHMEDSIENYFCDLVRQSYQQRFWDKTIARIPGCRINDSVLYFQRYRLFSMPDIPETSTMFNERLHYSLSENICFPQLQYDTVFQEFPYLLNMYLYVTYQSSDEAEHEKQCLEVETFLREMIDEMAQYTNHTLNATVSVTMMDEEGAAESFSLAVLNGAYFEAGRGVEYEIALHESFFN